MVAPFALLKCVGKAVFRAVLKGVLPFGEIAVEIAQEAYSAWSQEKKSKAERLVEVERVAQLDASDLRAQIEAVVKEMAVGQDDPKRQVVVDYLTLLPSTIHRSLRRPSDPTGTTVPPLLSLDKAADLVPLLPTRMPRFKQGDRPLPGVDWQLEELLGMGGFGEVWKARNAYFAQMSPVALKFCLDAATAGVLKQEAAVLNRVMQQGKHPGIVPLRHTYLSADPPCLEYEYVGGGDLTGLIRDWHLEKGYALSCLDATRVVLCLTGAVGFAHGLKPEPIVHRDLKPSNILVERVADAEPQLRITDFGIGRLALKQARFPGRQLGFWPSPWGRTLSVLLHESSGFVSPCGRCHEPFSFLRDRVGCQHGSAQPDADFMAALLSSAAGPPSGRRSAGAGSRTTSDTPTAAPSARSGKGSVQRRSRRS
jgi:hypothetical protein